LFIDSSQSGLKGVLHHNGNVFASVPVAHSVHLREIDDSLKCFLDSVNCKAHGWLVCGDFKVIALLLGLQVGYAKMPCFFCASKMAGQRVSTGKDTAGHQENL
jgi:hypothetical protein